MSTTTETRQATDAAPGNWLAGAVGGIVGAIVMGIVVFAMNEATLAVAIPSLYGLAPPPAPAVGMVVHVFHGAVLGLVFAGIVRASGFEDATSVVGLAIAWGVVTWIALAAVLMPVWLSAVGSPASPPLPNFAVPSLLWHLIYGLVLGGVFVATADRL